MQFVLSQSHNPPLNLPQFTKNGNGVQENSSKLIANGATPWLVGASGISGLYIHVPFCFHKCHYCDFFSIVGDEKAQETFVHRLLLEIKTVGQYINDPISTIFIGGGTPTLLEGHLLSQVLDAISENFTFAEEYEWSVEANPETVTADIASRLIAGGVNRVSIGAQSFDEQCLKTLERWHNPESVVRSVQFLRDAGIENLSLDLIFGIPNQSIKVFREDLLLAINLGPEHISSYSLTYEPNTPLTVKQQRGKIQKIDEDLELQMFEETMEILASNGYEQYEISNYAKPERQCKHNLLYWNNGNWWPLGPAASGHLAGRRWRNVPRLSLYNKHVGLPPIEDVELFSPCGQAGETFMLGLRLREGIPKNRVDRLLSVKDGGWRAEIIKKHVQDGLLAWSPNLHLTIRGIMLADTVIGELLMDAPLMVDTSIQERNG